MKIYFMKYYLIFLLLHNPFSIKAQINTYYPDETAIEMKQFAKNVMSNPDSITTYIAQASKYFDYSEFLKNKDLKRLSAIIYKFKECNNAFYSMCKNEVNYSHSQKVIYGTSIIYRNFCEEKVIQFYWILEDCKWKLTSIIKTDYISCYPKEDNQ